MRIPTFPSTNKPKPSTLSCKNWKDNRVRRIVHRHRQIPNAPLRQRFANFLIQSGAKPGCPWLISPSDALSSIEHAVFQVQVSIEKNDLRAVASSNKDWAQAWERGIEPIKQATLQGVRRDVWNMYGTLAEDSYTCQAAMVLLASELVGPYADRIATFLEYPLDLVRVIGARLHEAKIWEDDEVHYESWSDPQKGAVAFLLDLMVAEGELIRKWSGEKKQYAYHRADIREVSHLAV